MTAVVVSRALAAGVRIAAGLSFLAWLLPAERPDKKSIAAGLVGAGVLALLPGVPDFYRMALEAFWIAVCAARLQRIGFRQGFFAGSVYEIAVSLWQFLFMAGIGLLLRSPAFPDEGTAGGQAAVWLFHLLLLLAAAGLWRTGSREKQEKSLSRFVSAAALTGFIAVVTLSEQTALAIPEDTLTMWTILAIVLLVAILMANMSRRYEMERELARLKSEQAELLEREYTALNQAYAVNARLFHDFHNHIGALRQLLSHEKYAEAIQYLDELQAPAREMADTVWTGDDAVDYLINSKTAAAAADGIRLQAQVEFPRRTNIRSADLCAIVGNLLDNALEAARQVPEPEQRLVRLTIRRINQMLVIKVENPFCTLPAEEAGRLKTSKTEGGLHGWGLKSAQAAAEKYDGLVQTAYADGIFRAVATLSYQGVTRE